MSAGATLLVPRINGTKWRGGCLEQAFLLSLLPAGFTPVDYDVASGVPRTDSGALVLWFDTNFTTLSRAADLVAQLRPEVVVNTGDESGDRSGWDGLAAQTRLYLRQYHHSHYPSARDALMHYLPLGYHRGMAAGGFASLPRIHSRKFVWSWFGELRPERQQMISALRKFRASHAGDGLRPSQVKEYYLQSRYVPVGRGAGSLDCFRIYEAAACGAIPVVAGPRQECLDTFAMEAPGGAVLPPWLFTRDWEEAVVRIQELETNAARRDLAQRAVISWWRLRVQQLRALLATVV